MLQFQSKGTLWEYSLLLKKAGLLFYLQLEMIGLGPPTLGGQLALTKIH